MKIIPLALIALSSAVIISIGVANSNIGAVQYYYVEDIQMAKIGRVESVAEANLNGEAYIGSVGTSQKNFTLVKNLVTDSANVSSANKLVSKYALIDNSIGVKVEKDYATISNNIISSSPAGVDDFKLFRNYVSEAKK